MITKDGQVKNTSLTKNFLQRHNRHQWANFVFDKKTEPLDNSSSNLTVDFQESNKIDIYYPDLSTPKKGEIIHQTTSYIDIAGVDSIDLYTSDPYKRCQRIAHQATIPSIQEKIYPIYHQFDYTHISRFRPLTRIEIRNGKLYIPSISLLGRITVGNEYGSFCFGVISGAPFGSYGGRFGTFDTEIIKQLQSGDTIV